MKFFTKTLITTALFAFALMLSQQAFALLDVEFAVPVIDANNDEAVGGNIPSVVVTGDSNGTTHYFDLNYTAGTAIRDTDFELITNGDTDTFWEVSVPAGTYDAATFLITDLLNVSGGLASISFSVLDDAIAETPTAETLDFSITNVTQATAGDGMVTELDGSGTAESGFTYTINDDDTAAGITATESGGSTDVTEGGATDTIDFVLDSAPTADVTITCSDATGQVTVATSPMVFTPADFADSQSLTVTAVDDAVVEGAHMASITCTVESGDADYDGLPTGPFTANITDNDTAGITDTETGGSTDVTEGGATDTIDFVLDTEPTSDVTLTCTSSDPTVTIATSPMVFAPADYNTTQSLTVTAADDSVVEGAHNSTITCTVTSADTNYDALPVGPYTVNITDAAVPSSGGGSSRRKRKPATDPTPTKTTNEVTETESGDSSDMEDLEMCKHFKQYHRKGDTAGEIKMIQLFLNEYYDAGLAVDGIYGSRTTAAVNKFQMLWKDEVLTPWGFTGPTGRWYQSTRNKANEVVNCDEGKVTLDNGVTID